MENLQAGMIAFIAETLGLTIGFMIFYMFKIENKRFMGMLYGATSGIMIAMICFDLLPEALEAGNNTAVIIGAMLGIVLGLGLENFTDALSIKSPTKEKSKNIGVILLIGIAIHNIPEGFALGTIFINSPENIIQFACVICLHSIPEAIAVAIPFKLMNVSKKVIIVAPVILGSIMGIGAICGALLTQIAEVFIPVALGVAAGIILYIVCEELLPESRKVWNGRMTSVATIIGILLGMLIVK